jgi:hypothetical protein
MNTLSTIPDQIETLLTAATATAGNAIEGVKVVRMKWNQESPDAVVQEEMATGKGVVIFIGPIRERRSQTSQDGHFEGMATVDVMLLVNDRRNTSGGVNRDPITMVYGIRSAIVGRRPAGSFVLGPSALTIEEIGGGTIYAQEFETYTQWQ